jgi:hypothetical protein
MAGYRVDAGSAIFILAARSYNTLMHLSIKLLRFNQLILVLVMTILIAHHSLSVVYGMQHVSQQKWSYIYSIYSASVHTAINYNPGINNARYNIIEMVQKDHDPRQVSDPTNSAVITLQRHGTRNGFFPDYSLTVYGNGSVIYNGIKNVATSGVKTYQIPKDQSRELINAFINIYYFALKEKYSDSRKASNLPVVTTSININGQTKTVVDDHNSYAPPPLRQLEDKIDQLTNSMQWLKIQ